MRVFVDGVETDALSNSDIYLIEGLEEFYPSARITLTNPHFARTIKLGSIIRIIQSPGLIDHEFYVYDLSIVSSGSYNDPQFLDSITLKLLSVKDIQQVTESRGYFGSVSEVIREATTRVSGVLFRGGLDISSSTDTPSFRYQLKTKPLDFIQSIATYGMIQNGPTYLYSTLDHKLLFKGRKELKQIGPTWTLRSVNDPEVPRTISVRSFAKFGIDHPEAYSVSESQVNLLPLNQKTQVPKSIRLPGANRNIVVDPSALFGEVLRSPSDAVARFVNTQFRYEDEQEVVTAITQPIFGTGLQPGSTVRIVSEPLTGTYLINQIVHITQPADQLTKITLIKV